MATLTTSGHGEGLPAPTGVEKIIHPAPIIYYQIYAVLMVLLFLTVAMYYVDLNKILHAEWPNITIAMLISITKAACVIWFFMNLRGSTRLTRLWACIGFIWLSLMGGIFLDYLSRSWVDLKGWQ